MKLLKAFKHLVFHPIDFFRKWNEGYKRMTASDFAWAKRGGHFWGIIGLITGSGFMVMTTDMGKAFMIFLLAMIWLQIWEYRKASKQYENLKKMEEKNAGHDMGRP